MREWKEYEFQQILVDESISYGIVQPGSHAETDYVPVIRVNNIKDGRINTDQILKVDRQIEKNYSRTRLEGGELLITVVGSVGECAIVPHSLKGWNVARAVSVARIKNDFDVRFIKYAFKTEDLIFQIYGNTNDTVQATLNLSLLKKLKLNLPPLLEQRAIASILSSLDDKIDLLHRQNATLEGMAEVLFRQWFVVEAGDWEEGVVGDLIDMNYGKALNESQRSGHGYAVYGSSGVVGFHEEYLIEGPGVITGRKGTLGVVNYSFTNFYPIDTTFYVVSKQDSKGLYFEYFLLKTLNLGEMNSDSAVPGLNRNLALGIPILIPPKPLVKKFNEAVDHIFEKIKSNQTQIRTLTALRDSLLPKLMSGEIMTSGL